MPTVVRLPTLERDLEQRIAELAADRSPVVASRERLENTLAAGGTYYGINTGFGGLARSRIDGEQLELLQRNLLLSHAVGVGELVPRDIARLMLQLKIHSLGLGHSGVSASTFDRLLTLAQLDLVPGVPKKGSLGASGDLAPLAHLALPLIGEGTLWPATAKRPQPAAEVLAAAGLEPIVLHPKDGLALINGTQLMTAYGAFLSAAARELVKAADVVAILSLEALQGSASPFAEAVHELRPHPGAVAAARNGRRLLADSEVLAAHRGCGKVQDPYSLRCIPPVHGASRDALAFAARTVETEIASVTDNPLVLDDGRIVSAGNFHGQPLAVALDLSAIALAELAGISERRTYLLLEGDETLPALLMEDTGVNSGFMIPQYTAAALVSENKVLCHPASVDSIPTSLGMEDHVSMGATAATKLYDVFQNVITVLAIELLCAAQGLDFRRPLRSSPAMEAVHAAIRAKIARRTADGDFQRDLEQAVALIRSGALVAAAEEIVGELD